MTSSSTSPSLALSAAPSTDLYAGFKRALVIAMVANVVVGLVELLFPGFVIEFLGLPPALSPVWVRYAGLFLIVLTGTFLPVWLFPEANRYLAHYVIALRFVFAVFFLFAGGGFLWFALYDAGLRRLARHHLLARLPGRTHGQPIERLADHPVEPSVGGGSRRRSRLQPGHPVFVNPALERVNGDNGRMAAGSGARTPQKEQPDRTGFGHRDPTSRDGREIQRFTGRSLDHIKNLNREVVRRREVDGSDNPHLNHFDGDHPADNNGRYTVQFPGSGSSLARQAPTGTGRQDHEHQNQTQNSDGRYHMPSFNSPRPRLSAAVARPVLGALHRLHPAGPQGFPSGVGIAVHAALVVLLRGQFNRTGAQSGALARSGGRRAGFLHRPAS